MALHRTRSGLTLVTATSLFISALVLTVRADQPGESLSELLEIYRKFELPLPPGEAKLVRFGPVGYSVGQDGKETPLDRLGFLVEPVTAHDPAVVLVGTERITLDSPATKIVPVVPDPALIKDPTIHDDMPSYDFSSTLGLAFQCESRGWHELARALLKKIPDRVVAVYSPSFGPPVPRRRLVAYMAWMYWERKIFDPETDRAQIVARFETIQTAEPDYTDRADALASLKATLKPGTAQPGTIDAMIDDLVYPSDKAGIAADVDPALLKLQQVGFDAVPRLIDHWDDPRFTRIWHRRGIGAMCDVRTVVRKLIEDLAGEGMGVNDRQVDKADAMAWWAVAQRTGEEAYLLAHVLPADAKTEYPAEAMVRIIGYKYPHRLPGLYRTILEKRPGIRSYDVVKSISKSSLPAETKLELLLRGANDPKLTHRGDALWYLKDVDPERFLEVLIATLESLPETPTGPYWTCPEAGFARLVVQTDDPRAWAALEKAAKRCDVGLRLELMHPMNLRYTDDRRRKQRLEFLSHFLDDTTVRDEKSNPKMFDGPGAGFHFPRIEVRDYAASQIARILGMDVEPDKSWTPEQWAELRDRVRKELGRERTQEPGKTVRGGAGLETTQSR